MGRLDITICGARGLPDIQTFGKPDPYVIVKVSDKHFKTTVAPNTLNPKWEETFKFHVADENSAQIKFEVWNSNNVKDDFMAQYVMSVAGLVRGQEMDKWVLLQQCKANAELHVKLTPQDFGLDPSKVASPTTTPPQQQQQQQQPPSNPYPGAYPSQQQPYPSQQQQQQYPQQQHGYPQQQPHGYPPAQGGSAYPGAQQQQQYSSPHGSPPNVAPQGYGLPPPGVYPGAPSYHQQPPAQPMLPPPSQPNQWNCPLCHFPNDLARPTCGMCNASPHDKPPTRPPTAAPPPATWTCSACTFENKMDKTKCEMCETPRSGAAPAQPKTGPWTEFGLTPEEYDHTMAMFMTFDRDGSGKLSRQELVTVCRWLNFPHTPSDIERLFNEMDRDRSGALSLREFCYWLSKNRPDPNTLYGMNETAYQEVLFQFHTYDTDQDGLLTQDEFIRLCVQHRRESDASTALAIFMKIDTNDNGKIELHEYLMYNLQKQRRGQ